jgi:anti-repressor protein
MEITLLGELLGLNFEGHRIRVHIDAAGQPWWVAKDVCEVLNIANVSKAVSRLQEVEKRRLTFIHGTKLLIIDKAGLHRLLFRSSKPEAEKFKDWLFEKVVR